MDAWWWIWLALSMVPAPGDADAECVLLGRLDVVRQAAFVRDEPDLFDRVYAQGSSAADDDRATLAGYRERGLRLDGMAMVRERCAVTSRSDDALTLEVTDRLGPTSVTDRGGQRVRLPRDEPTARLIELRRTSDGWRIGAIR